MIRAAPCTSSNSYKNPVEQDSTKNPCAMVLPNGPAFARSSSTWIHCSSPVSVANVEIWSWVTVIHRLVPMSRPFSAGRSVTSTTSGKFGLPVSVLQGVPQVCQELRRDHAVERAVVVGQAHDARVVDGDGVADRHRTPDDALRG